MSAPNTSQAFDQAYRFPITFWGDVRIPPEVKALLKRNPKSSLEIGCGIGRLSRFMASHGVQATGIDWSPVAIERAKQRAASDVTKPDYQVGDATNLEHLVGPYDVGFDVGCFHCFDPAGQQKYVAEVARLLAPGGVHLIWALDHSPSDLTLSPWTVKRAFDPKFELLDAQPSRRRLVKSHWYWLGKRSAD